MIPREYNFDATEVVIIDQQIEKFLKQQHIVKDSRFQICDLSRENVPNG